jgi:hypothetical protein
LVIDALEVAYVNPLIRQLLHRMGDSDYTPLVGKLKSMGKKCWASPERGGLRHLHQGVQRVIFLESVAVTTKTPSSPPPATRRKTPDLSELITQIETILADQDEDMMYASELKDTLTRLRPTLTSAPTAARRLAS